MAEKKENIINNRNYETIGIILKPFFFYYIVYFITLAMLTFLVNVVVQRAGGELENLFAEQQATVNAIIGGLAMLAGILPLRSDFRNEICYNNVCNCKENDNYAKDIRASLGRSLFTITLAFTSSVAMNILFIALHLTENSEAYGQAAERQYGVLFPVGLFLYGIVSPFAEEVVFRGILYNRMKKFFPVAVSLVLSALLFGLYHGNVVQAAYGFLMGMLIAHIYEKCGRFFYAFLFHAVANTAVYVITGSANLYERFITWQKGALFAGISVLLLFFLHYNCSFRELQKSRSE